MRARLAAKLPDMRMPRRPMIAGMGLAALIATFAANPALAGTPAIVAPLEQKYGIKVIALGAPVYDNEDGRGRTAITCQPPSDYALEAYMPILAQELALYDPDVIRGAGLKRVVMCADLKDDGIHVGGLADGYHESIFIDVEGRTGQANFYKAKTVHHELMHLLDFKSHGRARRDDAWLALNPPGHRYGKGGLSVQGDRTQGMIDPSLIGFITRYGTASAAEDKAEIFAYMMVRPKYVADRAWNDDYLKRKVAHLKAEVQEIAPSLDSRFWDEIERLRGQH